MNIKKYWEDCVDQNDTALREYFHNDAYINWHNTNESFTPEEFIVANCEYPGKWDGEVERIENIGDLIITVTRVYSRETEESHHVTSFIKVKEGKIRSIDEYWGEDGLSPEWRQLKNIGCPIK